MPSPSYVPVIATGRDVTFKTLTTTGGGLAVNSAASTDVALSAIAAGMLFDMIRVRVDGRIDWGPGTGARDTSLYRSGAGVLSSDGSLRLGGSLGVGNSAAAATPGTVVKKVQIFDSSGNSLGFIPVYDQIT